MDNNSDIIRHFTSSPVVSVAPLGDGLINRTYGVTTADGQRAVLQRINTSVFREPDALMNNIRLVTQSLEESLTEQDRGQGRDVMRVIATLDGKPYFSDNGEAWRMLSRIDGVTVTKTEDARVISLAGEAFGDFTRRLADFPADKLAETIPAFHYTPGRLAALKNAVKRNASGRLDAALPLLREAENGEGYVTAICEALKDGSVPLRVTHNDTKLNNVVLRHDLSDWIAVIDLDTVMPGSMLFDYGDALRFISCSTSEDEPDVRKVELVPERFFAFTEGYMSRVSSVISPREAELAVLSAYIMTYECGIRFLADYIDGDVYFRTDTEDHNLRRAATQLALCAQLLRFRKELEAGVARIIRQA